MVSIPELEDMTREQLLALAQRRGVQLPAKGYIRHDQLVEAAAREGPRAQERAQKAAAMSALLPLGSVHRRQGRPRSHWRQSVGKWDQFK